MPDIRRGNDVHHDLQRPARLFLIKIHDMKTILVPTDFSAAANKALRFALLLARKQQAKVLVLNVYNLGLINPEIPFQYIEREAEKLDKLGHEKFRAIYKKLCARSGVKCDFVVREGLLTDTILETIANKKIRLVVMGTMGAQGIKEIFPGSHTSAVIARAKCPVIAVPERSSPRIPRLITFATDYHPSDIGVLKQVREMAELFNARIEVLHISDVESPEKDERALMDSFVKRCLKEVRYPRMHFSRIIGNDRAETLRRYIDEGSSDLLVMSAHQRSFIDRIFGTSVTRKVVDHVQVPLMAFHHKKNMLLIS
jgi:nucleotide-binding universal stress UspA family protein